MKKKRTEYKRIGLDMTPMIDVVFLLLIFFIMTFRIVTPEGDFSIKMPAMASSEVPQLEPPELITVRMLANDDGSLAGLFYGDTPLGTDFQALRNRVLSEVNRRGGPTEADVDVELAPDDHLRYEHVMAAITAVTGQIRNGAVYRICDQVKFAPRASKVTERGTE